MRSYSASELLLFLTLLDPKIFFFNLAWFFFFSDLRLSFVSFWGLKPPKSFGFKTEISK